VNFERCRRRVIVCYNSNTIQPSPWQWEAILANPIKRRNYWTLWPPPFSRTDASRAAPTVRQCGGNF
jgi:hypothetical protein